MSDLPAEVTTREAMEMLGYTDPSTVVRLVWEHKLMPSRKLPGKTGAYLFARADVEAYRDARTSIGELIESGAIATITATPDTAA